MCLASACALSILPIESAVPLPPYETVWHLKLLCCGPLHGHAQAARAEEERIIWGWITEASSPITALSQ